MAECFVTAMTVRVIWSVLSDLDTPQNKFVWQNMIQNQNQLRVFEPGNLGICVTINRGQCDYPMPPPPFPLGGGGVVQPIRISQRCRRQSPAEVLPPNVLPPVDLAPDLAPDRPAMEAAPLPEILSAAVAPRM